IRPGPQPEKPEERPSPHDEPDSNAPEIFVLYDHLEVLEYVSPPPKYAFARPHHRRKTLLFRRILDKPPYEKDDAYGSDPHDHDRQSPADHIGKDGKRRRR